MMFVAIGSAWAQGTAYAVFCKGNGTDADPATLYFLSSETVINQGDTHTYDGKSQTITNVWSGTNVTNGRGWFQNNGYFKRIVFEDSFKDVKPKTCYCWFYKCEKLTTIKGIENLNTSEVINMVNMFNGCISLTSLDLSSFNTEKVTGFGAMFQDCSSLTSLNVSNFNTSEATSFGSMFSGCSSLKSLDVSKFNTGKLESLANMFNGCSSLTSIDLSSFNTPKLEYMEKMFQGCSSLTSLDLSSFNTKAVTDMNNMFSGCSSLTSLNVRNFNTSKVHHMYDMFSGCSSLTSLDLSDFNTAQVYNMSNMFKGCSSLTSLIASFSTSRTWNMQSMFQGCSSLTSLDLSNFNTMGLTKMDNMFDGCSGVTSLNFKNIQLKEGVTTNDVFKGCDNLMALDLSNATGSIEKLTEDENLVKPGMLIKMPGTPDMTQDVAEENYIVTSSGTSFVRSFTAENPSTVCLPYAVSTTNDGGIFYQFYSYKDGNVVFKEVKGETTVANTAYLFIPSATGKVVFTGSEALASLPADLTEGDDAGLYGVYTIKTFTEEDANLGVYYGWANGEFRKAGNGATVKANRAYLKLPATEALKAPARLSISLDGDGATGISTAVNAENNDDAPAYNLQGQRVGNSYKGVVIKNGKKMIIK